VSKTATGGNIVYGVPEDLDLQFLHGAELIQVCIGLYQVQFNFDLDASISVEQEWKLYAADGSELDWSRPPPRQEPFHLQRLLGQRVAATNVSSPDWIELRFEAGEVLRIVDSSKEYESFSIQPGNIFI
jgi:hypothetical protein